MLKNTLLASALVLTAGSSAFAAQKMTPVRDNGFSYTYGQVAYDRWNLDHGVDIDALTGEGSFALDEHLFLRGGVSLYDGDFGRGTDLSGNRLYGGLGFHTPLQQALDLVGSANIVYDRVNPDPGSVQDDMGFELRGGLRNATTDKLELSGGLSYLDVGDLEDSDLSLYVQGLVKVSPVVDVGARVLAGDRDTIGVFGRYNF